MNEPAIDNAVQTTPPIISAATMPLTPFSPTATMTTDAKMSVINVIPLTGLEPTMAMALAATVVKRKAITAVRMIATRANNRLPSMTPNQKKRKVMSNVTIAAMATKRKGRSCIPRAEPLDTVSALPASAPFVAKPTALLMTPHERMIPIMPAIAIAPIPMDLP